MRTRKTRTKTSPKKGYTTIIKYLFTIAIILLSYKTSLDVRYVAFSFLELLIIILVSNYLLKFNKWMAYFFNCVSLLLLNIQTLIMLFGGTYTTLVMVTNLESIEALSGKAATYIAGIVALLVFTFLPIARFKLKKISLNKLLSVTLGLELLLAFIFGNTFSPIFALYTLAEQSVQYQRKMEAIKNQPNLTADFLHSDVSSFINRPVELAEKPNIVLVFVEGLSQNIIDDTRDIMPNVRKLQDNSLNFSAYYNHTFATYRGLIGQLYSGYQLNNYDENKLISIQDILKDEGYETTFINTEPRNVRFTSYLESFGFDHLISHLGKDKKEVGHTIYDKEAIELLYDSLEQSAKQDKPYFTAIYTYGTHVSLKSPDKKFGDGSNDLLNRFYNLDYHMGEFIEKFNNSPISENTIFVFTTDHATYQDADFRETFKDYPRQESSLDAVPFFIYHKGMRPTDINVAGRNSLSLAPTILDYIDISAPNYFLGKTLFMDKENNNSFDTVFHDNSTLKSSDQGLLQPLSETTQTIIEDELQRYFTAKLQEIP
ncbi:LTA synthase family protein [Streptococcus cameli]